LRKFIVFDTDLANEPIMLFDQTDSQISRRSNITSKGWIVDLAVHRFGADDGVSFEVFI
jgi:hypothetical protein